jgi:hypothetical protein
LFVAGSNAATLEKVVLLLLGRSHMIRFWSGLPSLLFTFSLLQVAIFRCRKGNQLCVPSLLLRSYSKTSRDLNRNQLLVLRALLLFVLSSLCYSFFSMLHFSTSAVLLFFVSFFTSSSSILYYSFLLPQPQ